MILRRAILGPDVPAAKCADGRVVLLDVPFTPLGLNSAVEEFTARLAAGQRGIAVFTPDAHAASRAVLCCRWREFYRRADFVLCDGAGLAWSSRVLGYPVPRAPGVDVAWALCRRAQERGWSVYLLGGRPGIASLAAKNLAQQFPGLHIAGFHHGYFSGRGPADRLSILAPDILLVGLGFPAQEQWIAENRGSGAGLLMGVGGTLDLWAGLHPRAPLPLRRAGLEWAWRALRQPRRAARLWAVPFVLYHTGLAWLRTHP